MSNPRPTYVYAPKITISNPDSESAKMLEELLKSKMPVASEHPNINMIVDTEFVKQSPSINAVELDTQRQSTTIITEKLIQKSPDIVYHQKFFALRKQKKKLVDNLMNIIKIDLNRKQEKTLS